MSFADTKRFSGIGPAGVLYPNIRGNYVNRDPDACLDEACGLVRSIGLQIGWQEIVELRDVRPATLFGRGRVESIGLIVAETGLELVVIDGQLSPIQQRNLEKAWCCKVIDRTGIILEIFGARAKTKEGRLQVELAALEYQRSRLVRSWTHLERQRGGFGFMGGPGERQIEADRRQIAVRIKKLEESLRSVTRTRRLQRLGRKRFPYPIVAIVGYTNAGKSSLFNRLTRAQVPVKDMLFATLDPTMRLVDLERGVKAIFSDTVGFVSQLPHELVASFSATLEEVCGADLIVNVRNAAHLDNQYQAEDVRKILSQIGVSNETPVLEVYNKVDLLDDHSSDLLCKGSEKASNYLVTSAITGEGCMSLLRAIGGKLSEGRLTRKYRLSGTDGAAIAWLYRCGEVLDRRDEANRVLIEVALDPADSARFERRLLAGQSGAGD